MIKLLENHDDVLLKIKEKDVSVVYSSLREFNQPVYSNGFAIKYVLKGTEHYRLNNQHFKVTEGRYLLSNSNLDGSVEINSKTQVDGLCLNLSIEFIESVVSNYLQAEGTDIDPSIARFFTSKEFLENHYATHNNKLGQLLEKTTTEFGEEKQIDESFFFTVVENLIDDQTNIHRQLQNLGSLKICTKKDIAKKLLQGREIIESNLHNNFKISYLAQEVGLSEYHFFRNFKHFFGLSPQQFVIQQRLEKATLLLQNDNSVFETAINVGFSDIYSFSKSFKKKYGYSPSSLKSRI